MLCKFCGKEIRDSAVFCKYCGKKQTEEPVTRSVESVAQTQKAAEYLYAANEPKENSKKRKPIAICTIAIILAALCGTTYFAGRDMLYKKGVALWNPETETFPEKALTMFKISANLGYAPAQYELGDCYYCGWGTSVDEEKAIEWYTKAANQGYAEAQYELGVIKDLNTTNYGESPVGDQGWHWDSEIWLKGKSFTKVADALKETSGLAVIDGYYIKFWLYDTYTYMDGDDAAFVEKYLPAWAKSMGKKIDTANIKRISPNTKLSEDVKSLMHYYGSDIAIAHINSYSFVGGDYIFFNNYIKRNNTYSTTIFPLIDDN